MKNFRRFRKWCEKNSQSTEGTAAAKKTRTAKKLIISALCFSLIGGVLTAGGALGAKASADSLDNSSAAVSTVAAAKNVSLVQTNASEISAAGCFIGADISRVSEAAVNFGLPQGAAVGAVTEGTPAAETGIQAGDIITAVNDESVTDPDGLTAAVNKYPSGSELTLSVYRQSEEIRLIVKTGSTQQNPEDQAAQYGCDMPANGDIMI